ncbi:MAG: DUF4912 domain-containing protein [Chthoniobacterales bacterium]|nr:DUF4912 domain-containing protein [Chthoniobacterales bacterium]
MAKDFELDSKTDAADDAVVEAASAEGAAYRISSQPVISYGNAQPAAESRALPRSYGSGTLCLMPRDPHSLFVYWDIDWSTAFRERSPRARKVYLRVLNSGASEQQTVEIEPMAGSCYVTVPEAGATYSGEIGFFDPPGIWNSLATSEAICTPPNAIARNDDVDLATVPFHLSFQQLRDALRVSKQENVSLTAMLAELRERARSAETSSGLTAEQRELASVLDDVQASAAASSGHDGARAKTAWTQRRLEEMLGFAPSSPAGGFTGSSRAI